MKKYLILILISLSVSLFSDNLTTAQYLYTLSDTITEFGDFNGLKIIALDSDTGTISYMLEGKQKETFRTFFSGNTYHIVAAGDDNTVDVDIQIYDDKMNLIIEDNDDRPDAKVEFVPDWTGPYYIRVILDKCSEDIQGTNVGWMILYSESYLKTDW